MSWGRTRGGSPTSPRNTCYSGKESDGARCPSRWAEDLKFGRLVRLNLADFKGGHYSFFAIHRTDTPPGPAVSFLLSQFEGQSLGMKGDQSFAAETAAGTELTQTYIEPLVNKDIERGQLVVLSGHESRISGFPRRHSLVDRRWRDRDHVQDLSRHAQRGVSGGRPDRPEDPFRYCRRHAGDGRPAGAAPGCTGKPGVSRSSRSCRHRP